MLPKRIIDTIFNVVEQAEMLMPCNFNSRNSRTFDERFKEHLKAPSPIYEHDIKTGHKTSVENFRIIGREGHGISRTIQEAIYIRVNNPTLNRNVGKYNMPHIWDKVLFTIPELRIN